MKKSHTVASKPLATIHGNNPNSLVNDNQHMEVDKYMSIFDLVEYRPECELVVGFNLTTSSLFIVPSRTALVSGSNLPVYSPLTQLERSQGPCARVIDKFLSAANMSMFVSAAKLEIESFERCMNRIETFEGPSANVMKTVRMAAATMASQVVVKDAKEAIVTGAVTTGARTPVTVTHFSDLVNIDDSGNGSDMGCCCEATTTTATTTSDEFKSVHDDLSSHSSGEVVNDDKKPPPATNTKNEFQHSKRMKNIYR